MSAPQPSASSVVHVTRRIDWPEGPPEVDRWSSPWPGYRPEDAYRNRLARLRAAGAEIIAADGRTIIVRHQRERWVETETLTFAAAETACDCGAPARGEVPASAAVPAHYCRQCSEAHCAIAAHLAGQ